jgi:hypothetical protein
MPQNVIPFPQKHRPKPIEEKAQDDADADREYDEFLAWVERQYEPA